jgi:hypothetical protein
MRKSAVRKSRASARLIVGRINGDVIIDASGAIVGTYEYAGNLSEF